MKKREITLGDYIFGGNMEIQIYRHNNRLLKIKDSSVISQKIS
jgi:hypothetical protein